MPKINLQPLHELKLTKEQIQSTLESLLPLLQGIVEYEIARVIAKEDEEKIKEITKDQPLQMAEAYDELYKYYTGKSLAEYSDSQLNDLIVLASNIYKMQIAELDKIKKLTPPQIKQLNHFINQGDFKRAEAILR